MKRERANAISDSLETLHGAEERLRNEALEIVEVGQHLRLHLVVVERAMDLAYMLRQFETDDEDLKVAQLLGMRTFNAFAASLKLAFSGYGQNSALIMRDVLETLFLLDLFRGDRAQIERWRCADKRARMKDFSPMKVRVALDTRDGFTSKKRFEMYELLSELAGHPTMKSALMMRPQKDGDSVIGPFVEAPMLEAVLSEMGRLAIQVGEVLNDFCPADWKQALPARLGFNHAKEAWLTTFYPTDTRA